MAPVDSFLFAATVPVLTFKSGIKAWPFVRMVARQRQPRHVENVDQTLKMAAYLIFQFEWFVSLSLTGWNDKNGSCVMRQLQENTGYHMILTCACHVMTYLYLIYMNIRSEYFHIFELLQSSTGICIWKQLLSYFVFDPWLPQLVSFIHLVSWLSPGSTKRWDVDWCHIPVIHLLLSIVQAGQDTVKLECKAAASVI